MKYLKLWIKKQRNIAIFSMAIIISCPLMYSLFAEILCDYFIFDVNVPFIEVCSSIVCALGFFPTCCLFMPCAAEYIYVLLDFKKKIIIDDTVVSLSNPKSNASILKSGPANKNTLYYIWRVRNSNNEKLKLFLFNEIFSFTGKTIGFTYKVSYFKYSKIIVKIEKLPMKKEKISKDEIVTQKKSLDHIFY